VATLLLAMGVGVLIGHNSTSPPTRAAAPQVITVAAGAGTGASTGSATSAGSSSRGGKHSRTKTVGRTKVTVVHLTPKTAKAAAAAATRVLGATAPKAPTVTVGQSCTAGTPGCQNGHFTGGFFGR
jgi:hypothetical protein